MKYFTGFINEVIFIITEMAPYLILGFFFAGLLYILFPKKRVRQYMGRDRKGAVVNAALLGVPLPLCSCGVIPTGISFFRNGASRGSTVSFLISTPQTGIDSILVTYSLLGLPFAIIRPIVALFTGIAGGLLTNRFDREPEQDTADVNGNNELPSGFIARIREMFRYAFVEFLQDISTWLVFGLLVAALISVVIPDDFFAGKSSNDLLEMLIILVAAIPVYICATASVPIAAVLMLKGLSPGAALVLLMAGPATNAATITMIGKVLGRKSLITYLTSIIAGAMVFGIIINKLLPPEWFSTTLISSHAGHGNHLLPLWLRNGSAVVLVILIVNGYLQKYLLKKPGATPDTYNFDMKNITKIKVDGMTCNHCKANVENGAKSVKGVTEAVADLATGELTISGESLDMEKIRSNIEALGYSIK
ncbi:MAG: heavy metal-associated domain-containing protein [Bacteroidia bacterium]|nr:MAG: heavy metal-associated domain-containing protein [Bacteroidia bacterium]